MAGKCFYSGLLMGNKNVKQIFILSPKQDFPATYFPAIVSPGLGLRIWGGLTWRLSIDKVSVIIINNNLTKLNYFNKVLIGSRHVSPSNALIRAGRDNGWEVLLRKTSVRINIFKMVSRVPPCQALRRTHPSRPRQWVESIVLNKLLFQIK